MSKAVLPYMLKQRGGRIINISSVSGINGLPGQTNYSSSKAGMIGFTKALAKELASFHICVNAIAPGPVDTRLLEGLSVKMKEGLLSNVPIKRMCKTEEVAMVMNFLADEELSPEYLTGQVITLDGGMGL
jgi:3-oxoacyl-[acyl-carrier protein] reductase